MFKATYHLVKAQLASFQTERQTYAKIILAPFTFFVAMQLIDLFASLYIDKNFRDHRTWSTAAELTSLLQIALVFFSFFYIFKSYVLQMRFIVNKEEPSSVFSIHLFKQSYLVLAYEIFFMVFWTIIAGVFGFILSTLIILYVATWYPFNIISVATDQPVDFFKVSCQIGKTAYMNLLILIYVTLFILLLVGIFTLLCILFSVKPNISNAVVPIISYIWVFLILGCFSRSFTIWQKEHLANS